MKSSTKGFSLVELLVTATIIGLLAAAGIVSYTTANRNSRNAKRVADLEQVRAALELYRIEEGCYPGATGCPGSNFDAMIQELSSNQYLSNAGNVKDPRPAPFPQYSYSFGGGGGCSAYQLCAQQEPMPTAAYCVCNP